MLWFKGLLLELHYRSEHCFDYKLYVKKVYFVVYFYYSRQLFEDSVDW